MTLINNQVILDVAPDVIAAWQILSGEELIADPIYLHNVQALDDDLLKRTFNQAVDAYDSALPEFQEMLYEKFGVQHAPIFTRTIAKWVTAVIKQPHFMNQVLQAHENLNPKMMQAGLPMVLDMLDVLEEGREEWKRAVYLLTLPLLK